jgi:hypothetical protein
MVKAAYTLYFSRGSNGDRIRSRLRRQTFRSSDAGDQLGLPSIELRHEIRVP